MKPDEPTLPERREAEVLARWLDGALTEIPDDLDEEVIEAVLALRPELAPAPTLSAEDILADVRSGPLAKPALAAVPTGDPPEEASGGGTLADPAPLPAPANTRRWVGWATAGLGGLAAVAAAALLFFGNMTLNGALEPVARLDQSAPQAAPSTEARPTAREELADVDADATADVPEAEPSKNVDELRVDMDPPAPADSPRPVEAKERMARAEDLEDVSELKDLRSGEMDGRAGGADGLGTGGPGVGGGGSGSAGVLGSVGARGAASSDGDRLAGAHAPVTRSAGESTNTRTPSAPASAAEDDAVADLASDELDAEVPEEEELAGAPARELETMAESVTLDASGSSRRQGRRDRKAEKSKAEAPAAADANIDLGSLERAARPTSPPAAETEALQRLLDAGQHAEARDSAQRMLNGGGLSDLRRADLFWVLGTAHQRLGAITQAEAAYREAIRLRGR